MYDTALQKKKKKKNGKQSKIIKVILLSDRQGNDFNHLDMNFDR